MGISALPLVCWEFDNTGVDAAGTGPTLTVSGYSATAKLGAAALGSSKNGAGAIGNLAPILTGEYSWSFWSRPGISGNTQLKISNGTNILWIKVDSSYDTTYWLINAAESSWIESGVAESVAWRMFTATFDGTTTRFYVNGVLKGTTGSLVVSGGVSGSRVDNDNTGQCDQTAIFDFALTADDITYLYNAGAGRAYADWEISEPPATGRSFVSKQCFLTA